MGQVDGKVALVTGGASGIGEACALTLGAKARVVITDIDDARQGAGGEDRRRRDLPEPGRGLRAALDRGRGRDREGLRPARRAGVQRRHRHRRLDLRDDAGRLAAPAGDQPRRRVPVGEALRAADAQGRRRLDHHDVVGRRPARRTRPRGLCRDQGRRAAVRQVGRAGMRRRRRQHPGELDAPRHHRHADLGQDSHRRARHGPQCADRSLRAGEDRRTAVARGRGAGHRQWRTMAGERR